LLAAEGRDGGEQGAHRCARIELAVRTPRARVDAGHVAQIRLDQTQQHEVEQARCRLERLHARRELDDVGELAMRPLPQGWQRELEHGQAKLGRRSLELAE
jgi:uncharacterized protein YjiS (DUF1127 family)